MMSAHTISRNLAWCFAFFLACEARAEAPTVFQTNGLATLLVYAPREIEGFVIRLADVLKITITFDSPQALDIKPPAKITNSAGWRFLSASSLHAPGNKDGSDGKHWRQDYLFEPLLPQALTLQVEPFEIKEGQGDYRKLSWKPIAVQVGTGITALDLKSLRDPTFIEPLPAPVPTSHLVELWVAAGVLLIGTLVLIYFWWRHRRRTGPLPARQRALRELERLHRLNLPAQGKVDWYHNLLANVVRRFLEKSYQLPARRRTTPEFLELLESTPKLAQPERDFLRHFFKRCDLAKFAGAQVTVTECMALAEEARAFVMSGQSAATK